MKEELSVVVHLKIMKFFVFFAFAVTVLVVSEGHAARPGKKGLEEFKKPMPKVDLLSDEEYKREFVTYDEVPLGDKTLAYSLGVPIDWGKITDGGMSTFNVNSKIFGEVARFYGPARLMGHRSRFTVQVIGLDYQLTAEQWFLQYLLTSGYSIQGFEVIDEETVEALFVLIEHRISYIVRARARINGGRVLLAQYFVPVENYQEVKVEAAQMVNSFTLKNEHEELVEEMTVYRFLDVAELFYPNSWELRAKPMRSIDTMGAKILNIASKKERKRTYTFLNGKINVKLRSIFSSDSLEDELRIYKRELQDEGISLRDSLVMDNEFKFHKLFDVAEVEAFRAVDTNEASLTYEVWLAHFSSGEYYYFMSLLTPTRENDFKLWSRNTQSFQLVAEHIKPLGTSLIDK